MDHLVRPVALAVLILSHAVAGNAQNMSTSGGKIFGQFGSSFGDGGAAILASGGGGIRVTSRLGIDFEVLHMSGLELSEDDVFFIQQLSFAPPLHIDRDANLTAFLTKMNVDFPVGDRLIPFVSGGGGVGRLSEEISYDFGRGADDLRRFGLDLIAGRPLIFPPEDFTRSETGLVLTLEGGLDVRLWEGLSVGAGAKWLRLLSDRGIFDFAQIASRVSYRF